ncbi:MAG TPA: DUF3467 domain-containing protein [Candidatus Angelobacter sp.]|jgi:hypothetical protein
MAKKEIIQKADAVQAPRKPRYPDRKVLRQKSETYSNFYANNVEITVSPWDMRLRFGQILEADEEKLVLEEYSTVFMSPQHAKAFAQILQAHIDKYEASFGQLKEPSELSSAVWAEDDNSIAQ